MNKKEQKVETSKEAAIVGNTVFPAVAVKYNVLTGLVHTYCKPYRTNTYWKAFFALIWRKIKFGRGYILVSSNCR